MLVGEDRRLGFWIRLAIVGLFTWLAHDVLVPVLLGGVFALLLFPVQKRVSSSVRRPAVASFLVTAASVLLVVVPFFFLAVEAGQSINAFVSELGGGEVQSAVMEKAAKLGREYGIPVTQIRDGVTRVLKEAGSAIASLLGSVFETVPGAALGLFLFVVGIYYFLRDGEALADWLEAHPRFRGARAERLFSSVTDTVQGAVLGTLAVALVQGVLTFVALLIFDVPGAALFAVIAGFLSLVPLVGTTPVTVGAVIYLLADRGIPAAVGMAVAAVIIGLSDNVVRPYVQSRRGRLHPLVALVAIFGGLDFFGIAGIFLGPVLAAMALWSLDLDTSLQNTLEGEST